MPDAPDRLNEPAEAVLEGKALAARELADHPLHRDPGVGGADGSLATASASRLTMPLGMVDQGVVSATNFLTTILVGKFAGASELGEYALAFTLLVLALTVQDCLVSSPYTVFHADYRGASRRAFLASMLLLAAFIAAAFSAVLVAVGATGLGGQAIAPVAMALAVAAPPAMLREAVRRFALSHLHVARALAVDVVTAVLQLAVLGWWIAGPGLSSRTALFSIAIGGLGGVALWAVRHLRTPDRVGFDPAATLGHCRRALSFGKWLCAARLAEVIDNYTVPWIIAFMLGLEATGGFIAADMLIAAANPFLMGFTNILAPRAAAAWAEGGAEAVRRVVLRSTLILGGMTGAFSLGIAILGPWALPILFGEDYAGYAAITAVLALGLFLGVLGVGADHGLRAMHRPQATLAASLAGLGTTAVCSVGLIPAVGAIGGAYALTAGCTISTAVRWVAFERTSSRKVAARVR